MSRRSSRVYLRKAFGWLRDAWLIVGVTLLLLVGLDVLYRSALAVFRPLLPQLFAASRGVEGSHVRGVVVPRLGNQAQLGDAEHYL